MRGDERLSGDGTDESQVWPCEPPPFDSPRLDHIVASFRRRSQTSGADSRTDRRPSRCDGGAGL